MTGPAHLHACRGCGTPLDPQDVFADLGVAPLANALLRKDQLDEPEIHYPLRVLVCRNCWLAQLPALVDPKVLFPDEYPFRSGLSAAWLGHCKEFADTAAERFGLSASSRVLEIGSNDGVGLLRFRGLGIPAMGIEPSQQAACEALQEGIATQIAFWTYDYARWLREGGYKADLVIARNVLAHVADLRDFLAGVRVIISAGGCAVFEVPYLGAMVKQGRWDQIYHEHHCYFSLGSLEHALGRAGLNLLDVEIVPTHGGSLRAYATGVSSDQSDSVAKLRQREVESGLLEMGTYKSFAELAGLQKRLAWQALAELKGRVAGYGASAKAATLLNYFGIGPQLVEYVADVTPAKWGRYLPGSRIPVQTPEHLVNTPPDVVINFCWNWREESERNLRRACPDAPILYLGGKGA